MSRPYQQGLLIGDSATLRRLFELARRVDNCYPDFGQLRISLRVATTRELGGSLNTTACVVSDRAIVV
jgi:hypothetical protein